MILSMPFPGSSSKKTGQTKGENVSLWEKNSSGDGQQTEENIVQEPVQAASAKRPGIMKRSWKIGSASF